MTIQYVSKHFWKLKNMGLTPEIRWRILKRSTPPSCFDSRCNLCLEEKIQIMLSFDPGNLLNQRCDLIDVGIKMNLDYFQK